MLMDGRRTDDGVTGILIAHLGAFGSGELKSEGDIVITNVRPTVCLLCYLLLNHWTKFNQSISKIFIPNFVCALTNERFNTYQMGFLFCRLGHDLGFGLGGA